MNTNAIHNILNLIGLIIGALIAYDWTGLGLSAETAAAIASGMLVADKVIKFAMNIVRDGFMGLWKVQPPVEK